LDGRALQIPTDDGLAVEVRHPEDHLLLVMVDQGVWLGLTP
jgi:hypothetical protein